MKVLVIDDYQVICNEICEFFKNAGVKVYHATNGLEGLVKAMKHLPDVIISDLAMPILNGFQLFRFLKNNPSTANIPLIMVTGNKDEIKKEIAEKIGIENYFVKPISWDYILNTAQEVATN